MRAQNGLWMGMLATATVAMTMTMGGCHSSSGAMPETFDLTAPAALDHWRDAGTWAEFGNAQLDPENDARLQGVDGIGVLVNGPNGRTVDLATVAEFGDVEIDLEFMVSRGSNSGVYVMGRYEIQILDSFGKDEVSFSDCGGIYQRWEPAREGGPGFEGRPPSSNASTAPGTWQHYVIRFRAPQFDDNGAKIQDAMFESVVHNGVLIHENEPVSGPTRAAMFQDEKPLGPLMVQGDHGPVAYRNVRIRPLD